jgi:anthranilate synthase component 1
LTPLIHSTQQPLIQREFTVPETTTSTIDVRVAGAVLPRHDPLDLYERACRVLPRDEVFLFEGAEGGWAAVGVGRLAEIRVHAGHVELAGAPAVTDALAALAEEAGLVADHAPGGRRLRFADPAQVWEMLTRSQRLFAVDTDVPADSYAFGFLVTLAYESAWHMAPLPGRTKRPRGPDITLTLFGDTVWYDRTGGPGGPGGVRHLRAESAAFEGASAGRAGVDVAALAYQAATSEPARPAGFVPEAPPPDAVRDSVSRETFLGWAARCLEHIRVGDIYQIQIGHRIDVRTALTPVDVFRRLRDRNPSPYMYLLPRADGTLIGASPELFFRIEGEGERIVMRPIAGTTPRTDDEEVNARRVKEMRESTKEQAEHVMLVDLCRNDIGRISRPSTQPVDRLMEVERFSHVFHLVSTVSGHLEPGTTPWQAIGATFPAGTMTGAPKVRAMEIIDGLEHEPRGAYAGAVGLVDVRGWSELALCIRTIEYDGRTYSTQSSAGMVALSDPEAEWRETLAKMGAAYWALTGEELLK